MRFLGTELFFYSQTIQNTGCAIMYFTLGNDIKFNINAIKK